MARIAIVVYEDYSRDSRVRRHARAIREAGHDVAVLALGTHQAVADAQRDGVSFRSLGAAKYRGGSRGRYILAYLAFAGRVARAVLGRRPDLVLVNNPPDLLVFAALPARMRGARLVLDVHDMTSDLYAAKFGDEGGNRLLRSVVRLVESASYRLADGIITVHPAYARRIGRRVSTEVVPVLNTPDGGWQPSIERMAAQGNSLRLGHHGTIVERFGLDLAVRAVDAARQSGLDVTLDVLGDGDFAPAVERLIDRLGLRAAVRFERRTFAPDDVPSFAARVDAGIAPYRRSTFVDHALPVKIVEYVRLGVPVISTDLPLVREYIGDGPIRYVEPDVAAIVAAIRELADPSVRAAMRLAAHGRALPLAWEPQRDALVNFICRMLGEVGRSDPPLTAPPASPGPSEA